MWHNMKWMNRHIGFHIKVQTNIFHNFFDFRLTYILSHVATQSFFHNRLMFQSWKQIYNQTFCKSNEVSSTWMHLHTFDNIRQDLSMIGCSWTKITSIRLCVTRVWAHAHKHTNTHTHVLDWHFHIESMIQQRRKQMRHLFTVIPFTLAKTCQHGWS